MAQRRAGRAQRPRGGRQETGYSAPADYDYAAPAQPAYGDDQDVYQVRSNTNTPHLTQPPAWLALASNSQPRDLT